MKIHLRTEAEVWFNSYRDAIANKIEAGWNAAIRGESADEKEIRSHMQERKRDWLERQRPA